MKKDFILNMLGVNPINMKKFVVSSAPIIKSEKISRNFCWTNEMVIFSVDREDDHLNHR